MRMPTKPNPHPGPADRPITRLTPKVTSRLVWRPLQYPLLLPLLLATAMAQAARVDTFSPQGEVAQVRQLRVSFDEAMVPFGDPRLPAPLTLTCDPTAKGSGRWVDAKTWVHDFAQDLPPGSQCQAKLQPDLKSQQGRPIEGPKTYSFNTGGPAIVRAYPSPDQSWRQVEEQQAFALLLNGPVDARSVQTHAFCEVGGIQERIPVTLMTGQPRQEILKAVGLLSKQDRSIVLQCARPAPPKARLHLVWGKGISTPGGVPSTQERRLGYEVRAPFEASFSCERSSARSDCLPIRPLRLAFSTPVPQRLAEAIVLKTPRGDIKPRLEWDGSGDDERLQPDESSGLRRWLYSQRQASSSNRAVRGVSFHGPLPERSALRIELPKDFQDDAGRRLSNAAAFPLHTRTAEAPPLAKFPAATFGILELNAEPTLPLAVRHVQADMSLQTYSPRQLDARQLTVTDDATIIQWLAKLRRYNENILPRTQAERELGIRIEDMPPLPGPPSPPAEYDPEARGQVQTRRLSLLKSQSGATPMRLPLGDKPTARPLELIGIPMPKPGFHVVELASPKLGQVLLDRDAPLYVRTSVLVTNLGVHFKWGSVNSGVWVTTLDQAKPVAGAKVQVSDCRGKTLWTGQTDAQGFAKITQELPELPWDFCNRSGDHTEAGYFVSARKTDAQGRADMAFVWSNWSKGIEPWRFNLGWRWDGRNEPARQLFHTVMDRTLLRAGQTVSMKHYARADQLQGQTLLNTDELPDGMQITHLGSGQEFRLALSWRGQRHAESSFSIPKDAKLGAYTVSLLKGNRQFETGQFQVEEFRLPLMSGRITPPKHALVQPQRVTLGLQINHLNGGGASGLPVQVSAQLAPLALEQQLDTQRFPGFRFEPPRSRERQGPLGFEAMDEGESDGEGDAPRADGDKQLVANKLPLQLDKQGNGQIQLPKLPPVQQARSLLVEASYADPSGEIQTLSHTLPVWPASLVLGIKADAWASVKSQLPLSVLALDTQGKPVAGTTLRIKAVLHRTLSIRKRLVGGFYAYDNQAERRELGEVCSASSNAQGLAFCELQLDEPGEIELIAEAKDSAGRSALAAASVWVNRHREAWFGGENQDRMDVIPEQRLYEPGQTARFQVRSPFRQATALISIERNGILETQTVTLSGKNPMVEIPVKPEWAPNVYVSVLAVRGRVQEVPWYSFFSWGWRDPSQWWKAYRDEGSQYQAPTAMVDLAKPAFKLGIAEIQVGQAAHRLKVELSTDKSSYPVRSQSQVRIKVRMPDGSPVPAGTEVALAAVDEALLELKPNRSWDLLGAMIQRRDFGIQTATAQMEIIGKRHYGKKAAPPGGGGGLFPSRELFDTLLLWNPSIRLDAQGEASVTVPLNDSLSSFRIVAVADAVQGRQAALYGTGQVSIRSTQDLQLISGLPPLVREGDRYRALFTLRNATDNAVEAVVNAAVGEGAAARGQTLPEQRHMIAAQSAVEFSWEVTTPFDAKQQRWRVRAQAGKAQDALQLTQTVAEAVPVTVQQASLMQLDKPLSLPIQAPAEAQADVQGRLRGGIELGFKPRLADGLPGVQDYFRRYPFSCLEQQGSIAIGLRDSAAWRALMARLPLYLDEDGLANYFPPSAQQARSGSDSLTAYLLSVSDEASRLSPGFEIPAAARSRMEAALVDFVEGRIKREFWSPAFLKDGDLAPRKMAALEALSRSGKVHPRLLDSIQILPQQWPTSTVIDWLMVLQRSPALPERERRMSEAEQLLRARLNVQGTRLGFSTERDDHWWWLMVNGDVNSVRLLLAVQDLKSWHEDMPRLMTGALQRQQRGHWSTTVSNAWGSLAVQAFGQRFEREPVKGSSKAAWSPGGTESRLNWALRPQGEVLTLPWPASATGPARLNVSHEGSGKPWLTLSSKAAVPLLQPYSAGFRISKTVTPLEPMRAGQLSRGDVLKVRLEIDVQADATWVAVHDPIPAGATILGSGLGRDSAIGSNAAAAEGGWLAYKEQSFEAYRAYYRYLPKGKISLEYTLRLNNPGQFRLPQTRVEAMYAPEMAGSFPNPSTVVMP